MPALGRRFSRIPSTVQAAQSRTQVIISLVAARAADAAAAAAQPGRRARPFHRGRHARSRSPTSSRTGSSDGAADGFNVMPPILPALLDDLHRRGRPDPAEARPVPPRLCGADAARHITGWRGRRASSSGRRPAHRPRSHKPPERRKEKPRRREAPGSQIRIRGCGSHLVVVLAVLPLVEDVAGQRDVALVVELRRRRARCRRCRLRAPSTTGSSRSSRPSRPPAPRPGSRHRCRACSLPARCPRRSNASTTGLGVRVLARIGREGHQRALAGIAGDLPVLVGDQRVARDRAGVHALLDHLAHDQAGFGVVAADIDDVDAGLLQLGDERGVVLLAGGVGLVQSASCRPRSCAFWVSSARPLP